jgi:hypothetical protein
MRNVLRSCYLQPEGIELSITQAGNVQRGVIPRLGNHAMFVAEL